MPSKEYFQKKAMYDRVLPGPGRIGVRLMAGGQEIDAGLGPDGRPIKLWVPEHQKMEGHMGEVVCVCSRYLKDGIEVEPNYVIGDIVVFGKYTGTEVQIDREVVVLMYDDDVLCEILPQGTTSEPESTGAAAPREGPTPGA